MNRYTISFKDNTIEPDDNGKWVKHADVTDVEANAITNAQARAAETMQAERQALEDAGTQITRLNAETARLSAALDEATELSGIQHTRHKALLGAAKDRLKLLGHAPNCFSRYSAISSDGTATVNECNCGLDDWFKESGFNG